MSDWPTERAWMLLKELEDEPRGVSSLEVDRMLEEWQITELLPDRTMFGYRTRAHDRLPNFVFHYPIRAELSSRAVSNICYAVRELHRRLQ